MTDFAPLLPAILDRFALDPAGIHGVTHWARVCENGRLLAPRTGARLDVVELFAVLHDAGRQSDGADPDHGPRGAAAARALRGTAFTLDDAGFDLLVDACERHVRGLRDADPTVQTCWDADRLDLGRVGVMPRLDRLCTVAARDLSPWAAARGIERAVPDFLRAEWGWGAVR